MPNRILRDWTDSERVDELTVQGERFFTRLIMKADDYGRYNANIKFLKSTLFPLKTDVREADITRWLTECEASGLVVLYQVAFKEYVQIENFKQVLRQKNEKYPGPEKKDCYTSATHMTSTREASASLNRIEVEIEVEGEGDKIAHPHPPDILESYNQFNIWIKKEAPRVLELKSKISIDQFVKLKSKYPDMKAPAKTLKAMHNYKPLTKNYVDAYLTLTKWLKKDETGI